MNRAKVIYHYGEEKDHLIYVGADVEKVVRAIKEKWIGVTVELETEKMNDAEVYTHLLEEAAQLGDIWMIALAKELLYIIELGYQRVKHELSEYRANEYEED